MFCNKLLNCTVLVNLSVSTYAHLLMFYTRCILNASEDVSEAVVVSTSL